MTVAERRAASRPQFIAAATAAATAARRGAVAGTGGGMIKVVALREVEHQPVDVTNSVSDLDLHPLRPGRWVAHDGRAWQRTRRGRHHCGGGMRNQAGSRQ